MKKIIAWYHDPGAAGKLVAIFILDVVLWILMALLLNLAWQSPFRDTPLEILLYGIWMGTLWTLIFHWKVVKATFSRRKLS